MSASEEPCDSAGIWAEKSAEIDRLRSQGLWLPGAASALQVLGKIWDERSHQAYIAWLLTPTAEHQLGTRVLASLLSDFALPGISAAQLSSARVRTEVVRSTSRADIVAAMRELTLVIELKTRSKEGLEQTHRLAKDFRHSPQPIMVFLTINGDLPLNDNFQPKSFRWLIGCIRAAINCAEAPRGAAAIQARATAIDYLTTIEGLCGMGPVNQHAAAFWMRHWDEMKESELAALRVFEMLSEPIERSLQVLAGRLGEDVRVSRFNYQARGRKDYYPVDAILLHRASWFTSDNTLRFGIGYGRRTTPSRILNIDNAPFLGLWAVESLDRAILNNDPGDHWAEWASWKLVDFAPPTDFNDLTTWCAEQVKTQVEQAWHDWSTKVDIIANSQ